MRTPTVVAAVCTAALLAGAPGQAAAQDPFDVDLHLDQGRFVPLDHRAEGHGQLLVAEFEGRIDCDNLPEGFGPFSEIVTVDVTQRSGSARFLTERVGCGDGFEDFTATHWSEDGRFRPGPATVEAYVEICLFDADAVEMVCDSAAVNQRVILRPVQSFRR